MFKKVPPGHFILDELASRKGIIHGFSTRAFGDCHVHRNPERWPNLENFLKALKINKKDLVLMAQVHGRRIKKVGEAAGGLIVAGVDGLVTSQRGIFLGIKTADCLPLLFYDPEAKIVGAAHAGWRGVVKGIQIKMVELMIRLGSLPQDILVGVGPAICDDCQLQTPPLDQEKLGEWKSYLKTDDGKIKVEVSRFCLDRLVEMGIRRKNIFDSRTCTLENRERFYSYRAAQAKGQADKEGRFISLIGMK